MRWNDADRVLQGLGVEVAVDSDGQWRLADTSVLVHLDADTDAVVEFSAPEGISTLRAKTPQELRAAALQALAQTDGKRFL